MNKITKTLLSTLIAVTVSSAVVQASQCTVENAKLKGQLAAARKQAQDDITALELVLNSNLKLVEGQRDHFKSLLEAKQNDYALLRQQQEQLKESSDDALQLCEISNGALQQQFNDNVDTFTKRGAALDACNAELTTLKGKLQASCEAECSLEKAQARVENLDAYLVEYTEDLVVSNMDAEGNVDGATVASTLQAMMNTVVASLKAGVAGTDVTISDIVVEYTAVDSNRQDGTNDNDSDSDDNDGSL